MSFADPTSLVGYGSAGVTTWATPVPASMARQADGRYISTNIGTADEPLIMIVNNVYKAGGVSTFTVKTTLNKNVAPINGVPQSDDILIVSTQVKFPHRSFTGLNLTALACGNLSVFVDTALRDKIVLGQR